jgi:uncharacterized protein
MMQTDTPPEASGPVRKWACMPNCGACCFLGDYDLPVMEDMLKSPADVETYLGMIDADGWCKYYDKASRGCTVYSERPSFCRVELSTFSKLYDMQSEEEMNEFAIQCCVEHISEIYPAMDNEAESSQMNRFRALITNVVDGECEVV